MIERERWYINMSTCLDNYRTLRGVHITDENNNI